MKHKIISMLLSLCGVMGLYAQNNAGTKILVFRNTGEINVFNSDSISRIELSVFDSDSIEHPDFVSQVFHYKNETFLTVPLSEIDSVAFGVRNIIEPKKGIRKLTDEEVRGISAFDGEVLTYDTRLKLEVGEIVYYDQITEILPYALCVRINDVGNDDGNNKVASVELCDPADVFDRYLITGDDLSWRMPGMLKASEYGEKLFKIEFKKEDEDGLHIEGSAELQVNLEIEDGVMDFVNHYYHGNIKLHVGPKLEFKIFSENSGEINYESPRSVSISYPFMGGLLKATLDIDLFCDLKAELGIAHGLTQDFFHEVEWTRKNGENIFGRPHTFRNVLGDIEHKLEAHLAGEVFLGPKIDLSLNTAFTLAGAGMEIKIGPKLEGAFSLGVLQQLSEKYDQEAYGKARLGFSLGAKTETYCYTRELLHHNVIKKIKLPFSSETFLELDSIVLFPDFHSRAVLCKETSDIVQSSADGDAVSVSTYTDTKVSYPLNVSFEIADKDSDETIEVVGNDDVFILECDSDETQNMSSELKIPDELGIIDKDMIVARPIINYKGYKVKAAPVNVMGDMFLTPMIASAAGGGSYFISGMTPVSQHDYDEGTYIEGNLIGLIYGDNRHKKRTFSTIDFIDLSDLHDGGSGDYSHPLFGEWTGKIGDTDVCFNFIDNKTGNYNGSPFTYKYNSPLQGGVAIKLEDGGTISFSVLEISDDTMTIVMKGAISTVTLSKK